MFYHRNNMHIFTDNPKLDVDADFQQTLKGFARFAPAVRRSFDGVCSHADVRRPRVLSFHHTATFRLSLKNMQMA